MEGRVMDGRKTYRVWDPRKNQQQAYSPEAELPEDDLVYFLLDTVPQLDLSAFYAPYERETRGAPPYDVAMMCTLLTYAYCVGVFSSRKMAAACERNLAFKAIVGAAPPNFRTISDFRKIHHEVFADLFVEVLRLAGEMGLVRLGNLAIDGTKVQANASRHKAMSYAYMNKEIDRVRAEIKALLARAEEVDAEEDAALGSRRGDEMPAELKRREDRLRVLAEAKKRLEEEKRQRAEEERARRQQAEAERAAEGKKRPGRQPQPVSETPADKAQTNFTDPEAKIMKTNNKGFDYCYNAQAAVDETHQIIVAAEVSAQANDKQQGVPMAQASRANLQEAAIVPKPSEHPTALAQSPPRKIVATLDSGYFSEEAVAGIEKSGFDPHIATGRHKHNTPPVPIVEGPPPAGATAKERMAHKLRTKRGREHYAKRKRIVEPVFGQIKSNTYVASADSCCAASRKFAANGTWSV
jgi:transposase